MEVYKLKDPIQNGTELISELSFRKPLAKDIRRMPITPSTGDMLDLAGALCGHPPSVIDKMSIDDTMGVMGIVGSFMQGGQETGNKA